MTHAAPRRPTTLPKIWMAPVLAAVAMVVATAIGWLSRSILVDFVAWWPLWFALLGVGVMIRGRRVGALRLSGLVSLSMVVALIVFVVGHVQAWPIMPSSVSALVGSPDTGVTTAALSARMDGELEISTIPSGDLYRVTPVRGGGNVGIPRSVERTQDGSVSVELAENPDPGLYQFAGWRLTLSSKPTWTLSLGGVIVADLSALSIEAVQLEGSGSVVLGSADGSTPVSTDGDFTIRVPAGAAIRVVGPAEVPSGWIPSDDGYSSPTEGQGWVIAISEGSLVRITES